MDLQLNNQETTSFIFDIILIADIKYKLTEVNIPGISIGTIEEFPSFAENRIPFPGDTIDYDDLVITFIVDKDMNNYYYIFNWMKGLIQNTRIEEIDTVNTDPVVQNLIEKEYSDALLLIYTGDNLSRKIRYKNIFPYQLSEIAFTSTEEFRFSTCTASFKYENFDFMD